MLNDKVLKSVADAVTKVMAEALKGDQHKIDKNKNNKIDAHDFKLLRKEETVTEEEKKKSPFDWKNTPRETREKGELTGHASKRTSTGTVYTKKAVKEEASQEEFNKEIEKAKAKASGKVAQPEVAKPAVQAVQQEEVQQIDELSKKTLGSYIKKAANDKADVAYHRGYDNYDQKPDWTPMKAKVHYGQQNRNRGIKRAVARLVRQEEVQQIDELSRRTLGNYIKKAANDKADTAYHAGHSSYSKPDWTPMKDKVHDGQENRNRGIKRAINKLTREEAEQIDERHLTSGEKAEVEKNVKGMKKNLQGFKARYGDRAKEVMYATATKQAKGE
jgi:hypothetical protein